jgi:hypothetical protein
MTRISKTVIIFYIYIVCPKRNRFCELAKQRAPASRMRWWRCVAGSFSFILIQAASCRVSWSSSYALLNECVFSTVGEFPLVDNCGILKRHSFALNSISNLDKHLERVLKCCNSIMESIVWTVRIVTSGIDVSNQAEHPSKATPNLDDNPHSRWCCGDGLWTANGGWMWTVSGCMSVVPVVRRPGARAPRCVPVNWLCCGEPQAKC